MYYRRTNLDVIYLDTIRDFYSLSSLKSCSFRSRSETAIQSGIALIREGMLLITRELILSRAL